MEQRTPAGEREPREIRTYLIAPATAGRELSAALDAALETGDAAAILFPAEFDGRAHLVARAQGAGVAALALPEARTDDIDGVHVDGDMTKFATLRRLKPDDIVGFGGVARRHDGMTAAEAGADYVAIGRLADSAGQFDLASRTELLGWWQTMMSVPCVARAETVEEAEKLAEAGADFVALAPAIWTGSAASRSVAALVRRFDDIARAERAAEAAAPV